MSKEAKEKKDSVSEDLARLFGVTTDDMKRLFDLSEEQLMKLDEVEFTELRQRVEAFMWSDHARRFLWPHLSEQETYQMVSQWLEVPA